MNIVFDFGAVLFTWQPAALLLQTLPEQIHTLEQAAHLAHQVFGHPDWHDFDRGVLDADTVIARTAERLDLPLQPMGDLVHGIAERLTPIADTVAVLQQLHQRRQAGEGITGLYFLSNMPVPYARFLEKQHAWMRWFDGGIFSGDVLHIKPDPAIYHMLQRRYALDPEQTVFIDDLKANVKAAQLLGWQGIHFDSPRQLQADLALLGL